MRDTSPMSLWLVRDFAIKSHSSSSRTQERVLAASKTDLKLMADSPKYEEISASNCTFMRGSPVFHARRFAPRDFPQPGGPYRRIVFLGLNPNESSRSRAAYSRSILAKRSSIPDGRTIWCSSASLGISAANGLPLRLLNGNSFMLRSKSVFANGTIFLSRGLIKMD